MKNTAREMLYFITILGVMNFFNNTLVVNIRALSRRYGDKIWRFHVQPSY